MSSGVRNVADALVDLATANVDIRGNVDDELLKTTERLINHNPSLVEWVPDLVMERRGSRSGALHAPLPLVLREILPRRTTLQRIPGRPS
jgi:hypothetical protein